MSAGYVLTEQAVQDLIDIWDYIAQQSIPSADAVTQSAEFVSQRVQQDRRAGLLKSRATISSTALQSIGASLVVHTCVCGVGHVVRGHVRCMDARHRKLRRSLAQRRPLARRRVLDIWQGGRRVRLGQRSAPGAAANMRMAYPDAPSWRTAS